MTQEQPVVKYRYIQSKLTEEEFKEISLWLIQNDISDKSEWMKMILLREVRGYEPVRTDKRLPASENGDGFDTFRGL